MNLGQPISQLKGVGASLEVKLARLGVETVGDLIKHYPRRYDDFSKISTIREIKPGPVTLKAKIINIATRRSYRRRLSITEAILSDGTGTLKAIWFNQSFLVRSFPVGSEVYVAGRLEFKRSDLALQSPNIELADQDNKNTARIIPIYSETEGLTSKQLRTLVLPLVPQLAALPETLPVELLRQHQLMERGRALAEVHFPSSMLILEQARRRIAFEELFFLILASQVIRQDIKTETGVPIKFRADVAKQFTAALAQAWRFSLTDAQRRAAWEILQDLDQNQPMNRLLQGDVGSGKTLVAVMAAVMTMAAGFQVSLMVPTEILARQHHAKISQLLGKLGFTSELLLGSQPAAAKRNALEAAANGQANLVIGTHALLAEQVKFKDLGLVIVDEQHRFGVSQRQQLKLKAGRLPHLLTMTATPIPRSLALTVYGDLDVSVIDALPPGRQPIETEVVFPKGRDEVYAEVDAQIAKGRQVYVVCPLISDSDKLGAKSVTAEAERLQQGVFSHRRLGLLHGKLKPEEKQRVMSQFVAGEIDLLVSTTVIEVGVDVPNATIMMVEGAERFGLAALHQLRGRVGRGKHKSYCYLLTDNASAEAATRLEALERTNDGFRLAQIDLELRGPGAIYGQRQHGVLDLKMADLSDVKLISQARTAALEFLAQGDAMLKYPQVAERVDQLKAVTTLD